jgi:hypothetical protein
MRPRTRARLAFSRTVVLYPRTYWRRASRTCVCAENSVGSLTRGVCATSSERTDDGETSEARDHNFAIAAQRTYAVVGPADLGASSAGSSLGSGPGVRRRWGLRNLDAGAPLYPVYGAALSEVRGSGVGVSAEASARRVINAALGELRCSGAQPVAGVTNPAAERRPRERAGQRRDRVFGTHMSTLRASSSAFGRCLVSPVQRRVVGVVTASAGGMVPASPLLQAAGLAVRPGAASAGGVRKRGLWWTSMASRRSSALASR